MKLVSDPTLQLQLRVLHTSPHFALGRISLHLVHPTAKVRVLVGEKKFEKITEQVEKV